MRIRFSRGVVPLLAAALLLTGCRSDPQEDAAPAATSFDVTIQQRFGTAKLTKQPQKVVALNQQAVDTVLAFGVKPAGYTQNGLDFPWQKDNLDSKATEGMAAGGTSTELNYEVIAALAPDLIVAGYSAFDKETFDKLTKIAPTIGPIEVGTLVAEPWQAITTAVGQALGQQDKAKTMIADTEAKLAAVKTDVPGIEGKTYSFVNFFKGEIYAPLEGDGASNLFKEMGLQLAPGLTSLKSKEPRVVLSSEQLTLLDGDLILAVDGSKSDRAKVEADSRYAGLPAVKSKAILWFDLPVIYGLDTPSVLSIPYCLDYIKPTLETAAKAKSS